jgi:hypothetical protein
MTLRERTSAAVIQLVSSIWFAAAVALCSLSIGTAASVHLREAGRPFAAMVVSGIGLAVGGGNLGWAVRRMAGRGGTRHDE